MNAKDQLEKPDNYVLSDNSTETITAIVQRSENNNLKICTRTFHSNKKKIHSIILAEYSHSDRILTVHPGGKHQNASKSHPKCAIELEINNHEKFLESPIYEEDEVHKVVGIPEGLGQTLEFRLTTPRKARSLFKTIEIETDCTTVRIGSFESITIDDKRLFLPIDKFNQYINKAKLYYGRADNVKSSLLAIEAFNILAEATGQETRELQPRLKMKQQMKSILCSENGLDAIDRENLVDAFHNEITAAVRENPTKVRQLNHEIELASLDELIRDFESKLEEEPNNERLWQEFYRANCFALQHVFSFPAVLEISEATVKTSNMDGSGAQRADFLLANPVNDSACLIEIKKPSTPLLGKCYRGKSSGQIIPPSHELSGSVSQLQTYMESARKNGRTLTQDMPRSWNFDHVTGAIIVGRNSNLTDPGRENFERYRHGLKDLQILTYDEIAYRLRLLHQLLSGTKSLD